MKIVKNYWHHNKLIISKSMFVVSASFLSNIFAYLFQLFTGRYFSIEDYGRVTSLFSLSGIIPLVLIIFFGAIPKIVAEIKDKNYPQSISQLFFTIIKVNLSISAFLLLLMLLFAKQIGNYLNIDDIHLIYAFSVAVFMGMVVSFIPQFLQGLLRFKAFSLATFLNSSSKLAVGLVIIFLGLGVTEIYIGLSISTFLLGIVGYILLLKNIRWKHRSWSKEDFPTLIAYSLAGAMGLIGLNLIQNIDLIEVKHLFSESVAGIYGSTSVIGKIIFYLASPVAIVMMPMCAEKFKKGEDFLKPFLSSLGLTTFISASVTLFYILFPNFVINILFGAKYLPVKEFLAEYAVYTMLYSLMYFITIFFISISRFKIASIPLLAAVLQYTLLKFFAHDPHQVIYLSLISVLFAIIPLLIYLFKLKKEIAKTPATENEN